jgi:hypothetical protein
VLDRPIQLSVEGIDRDPTLRSLAERLISQLEMWVSAVGGGTRMPTGPSATGADLQARLDTVAPRFREAVLTPVQEGRADETFIDAICDPPETFSFGGILAHVLTFPRSGARWRSGLWSPPVSTISAPETRSSSSVPWVRTPQRSAGTVDSRTSVD